MFGTGTLLDGPRDLDGDGAEDVAGPGTLEALESELRELGRGMREQSRLLIFLTDHGQLRWSGIGLTGVAMMWQGGELRGRELDRMLRAYVPDSCWVESSRRNAIRTCSWTRSDARTRSSSPPAAPFGSGPARTTAFSRTICVLRCSGATRLPAKRSRKDPPPRCVKPSTPHVRGITHPNGLSFRINGDERLIPKPF